MRVTVLWFTTLATQTLSCLVHDYESPMSAPGMGTTELLTLKRTFSIHFGYSASLGPFVEPIKTLVAACGTAAQGLIGLKCTKMSNGGIYCKKLNKEPYYCIRASGTLQLQGS